MKWNHGFAEYNLLNSSLDIFYNLICIIKKAERCKIFQTLWLQPQRYLEIQRRNAPQSQAATEEFDIQPQHKPPKTHIFCNCNCTDAEFREKKWKNIICQSWFFIAKPLLRVWRSWAAEARTAEELSCKYLEFSLGKFGMVMKIWESMRRRKQAQVVKVTNEMSVFEDQSNIKKASSFLKICTLLWVPLQIIIFKMKHFLQSKDKIISLIKRSSAS